jgi:uncharacterized membrane protein YraQ (UPF0718 family)
MNYIWNFINAIPLMATGYFFFGLLHEFLKKKKWLKYRERG